ncbi:MAG: hypothetical protein IJG42_00520 [Muribaculaceae bacterium]|nr:hypothetical protein [Muribaculaceae bacterium]
MKHLLTVILSILALVAVVTGCGGAHRYDARLVRTDSLMRPDPDSALAIVQAVDRDSLTSDGDRAYRDLLLTQARYRCYVPATSDSDINRALAYYRAHSGEREKLTRALIYKGTVMDELGHPDSAMLYYKQAEATAAPDDYFNLGYSKMRIATLYQDQLSQDSSTITRLKQAIKCFEMVNDTNYLISCYGHLGGIYGVNLPDSTEYCLTRAIELAQAYKPTKQYTYKSKLAGLYYYHYKDYMRSKELAMDVFINGRQFSHENQFYYYAALSYIRLGLIDSALFVFKSSPLPTCTVDSMNYYRLSAELAAVLNSGDSAIYKAKAEKAQRVLTETSLKPNLVIADLTSDHQREGAKLKKQGRLHIVIVICIMLLLTISILFIISAIVRKRISSYQQLLDGARSDIESMVKDTEQKLSELEEQRLDLKNTLEQKDKELSEISKRNTALESQRDDLNKQVTNVIRDRLAILNEIYYNIRVKTNIGTRKGKRMLPLIALIKELNENKQTAHLILKESFWEKLKKSVDDEYHGLATFVERKYPELSTKDYRLFLLSCADISTQIIKLCLDFSSAVTVSNYKRRLIKEKIGIDVKFDEFINLYLDNKLE